MDIQLIIALNQNSFILIFWISLNCNHCILHLTVTYTRQKKIAGFFVFFPSLGTQIYFLSSWELNISSYTITHWTKSRRTNLCTPLFYVKDIFNEKFITLHLSVIYDEWTWQSWKWIMYEWMMECFNNIYIYSFITLVWSGLNI